MKILIVDDDTTSRLLLGATLKKLGHDVTAVDDGLQALASWRQEQPALIISDWMMPGMDGLELCRHIRAESALQYTYVVLLTSLAGKGRYLDGMQAGADDFISKPYDEDLLTARLQVAERILALHHALRVEATQDRLTGLWNRAAILDCLQLQLERASDEDTWVGIVLVDLDHFKVVNDSQGHAAGDQVLQEAARRMQSCMGDNEHVGRYGGEEFLAITRGSDPSRAAVVAERMRTAISDTEIATPSGSLRITASFGVAMSLGKSAVTADTLIATADAALYRAKQGGRNRVETALLPDLLRISEVNALQ